MGGCLVTFGFADKIKTVEAAQKNFAERAEQDRYENGHSYSGTMGMLDRLRPISTVFDTVQDFEKFLENKDKNDGYIAQVRVIRETKPLLAAQKARNLAEYALQDAQWRRGQYREKAATPGQIARLQDKLVKAEQKYRALLAKQAAKSTKTRLVGGGICSS